ncbi:MAG: DNA topoisomerase III [Gammaproteobacteria bacterium]|nr:DNA topoisomerase III [Gammaproteobacteria bacterium]MBY0544824.1 DNA topoisomerase III [Gammaproteobacteria bacterium]
MILYICEKPAQARDIARNLSATNKKDGYLEGNGYQVTWCVGHLLELAPPEYYKPDISPWHISKLPIIPQKWELLVSAKTKKQYNIIKELLKKAQHVVIASDPDREGETIVRSILDKCNYKGRVERLWLSALDDKSIQKALQNIRKGSETESLYHAGIARSRSDYLIGMNMTMAVSYLYGVNSVLSVGRVQTPTLKLVVDRDSLIENFIPHDYFVLKAQFSDKAAAFWATWQIPKVLLNNESYCVNQHVVETTAAKVEGEPGKVSNFTESVKYQSAPLCFSLSSLQKKVSSVFDYSAKQVLDIAQSLYETHKAITYPRTDCGYLPEEQFEEADAVLSALCKADNVMHSLVAICDTNFRAPVWDTSKITAHHGIIPTLNESINIHDMSLEEFNIYDLIRRQYLAQFLGDYEYQQRKIELQCAGETFIATGHTPVKLGWKQVFQSISVDNEVTEVTEQLPLLEVGQAVENQEVQVESKQTKPPARYTEGTLIEAMKNVAQHVEDNELKNILKESNGIGTEATRANILETLFNREYLARQKKQVISTDKGRALIALVPESVKNPLLTAQWEQQLDAIVEGQSDYNAFVESQANLLNQMLSDLQNEANHHIVASLQLQSDTQNSTVYMCPTCEAPLRRLKNKNGNYFWGCTRYPNCKFIGRDKKGKPII